MTTRARYRSILLPLATPLTLTRSVYSAPDGHNWFPPKNNCQGLPGRAIDLKQGISLEFDDITGVDAIAASHYDNQGSRGEISR